MKKAFTLIELLVVIAIIAILAAILFPVFAQAKTAAKKTSDLSSVKQTTLGAMLYLPDSDDTFVGQNNNPDGYPDPWNSGAGDPRGYMGTAVPQNWAREIQPYMKSTKLLESVAAPRTTDPWYGCVPTPGGNASWMMNGLVQQKSATGISAPADLVLFEGSTVTTRESISQPAMWDGANKFCHAMDIDIAGNTFGKGANYGWADGHASYKRRDALTFRNMGASGTVHRETTAVGSYTDVPNTANLTDPAKNLGFWRTWGTCDISGI